MTGQQIIPRQLVLSHGCPPARPPACLAAHRAAIRRLSVSFDGCPVCLFWHERASGGTCGGPRGWGGGVRESELEEDLRLLGLICLPWSLACVCFMSIRRTWLSLHTKTSSYVHNGPVEAGVTRIATGSQGEI